MSQRKIKEERKSEEVKCNFNVDGGSARLRKKPDKAFFEEKLSFHPKPAQKGGMQLLGLREPASPLAFDQISNASSIVDVHFRNADFVKELSYTKLLEEYEIRDQIGEGTYGRVYKALHKPTGLIRALKQIKLPEENQSREEKRRMDKVIQMAENEWNLLKKLDHPGIVRLIDIYKDKTNFYLVTEFCEGCELFDEVCKREYFSERDAAIILK